MKGTFRLAALGLTVFFVLLSAHSFKKVFAQINSSYFSWGYNGNNSSWLSYYGGGSVELGQGYGGGSNPIASGTPYIDFHYGNGLDQDYNYRIINGADSELDFNSSSSVTTLSLKPNGIQVNGGIDSSGNGIKHVRTDAGCTTGSSYGATCTVAIIWSGTTFSDTNYTATCTPKNVTQGTQDRSVAFSIPDSGKTTTGMNIVVENMAINRVAQMNGFNCIAIHD